MTFFQKLTSKSGIHTCGMLVATAVIFLCDQHKSSCAMKAGNNAAYEERVAAGHDQNAATSTIASFANNGNDAEMDTRRDGVVACTLISLVE